MKIEYNSIGSNPLVWIDAHRLIYVHVEHKGIGSTTLRVLPDTGAYLTLFKRNDMEDVIIKDASEDEETVLVGGAEVNYTLAILPKLYLGKLQLHDVRIGIADNLEMNLLGSNVLECINPLFSYSEERMYYTNNNGLRPLANKFPLYGCGKVYTQTSPNLVKSEISISKTDKFNISDMKLFQSIKIH